MPLNLHIIIASELYEHGGGCETWLNYFLRQGLEDGNFDNIHIYHIYPRIYKNSIIRHYDNKEKCHFHSLKLDYQLDGNGIKNIFNFTRFCLKALNFDVKQRHIVLLIGSVYLAPLGILLKLINYKNKDISLFTWVRSIAVEELKTRNKKFSYLASILETMLLFCSKYIITNGEDTLAYYKARYRLLKSKIVVIANAVSSKEFYNLELPKLNNCVIKCAYLGRFANAKGFLEFIESIKKIHTTTPELKKVEFHIYGHSDRNEEIPEYVINHGAYSPNDIVNILEKNQVIFFLNKSNIAGGLSHGLLEAMAGGRLIVAWGNAIHRQILNERNAILLEEGDIDGLVKFYKQLTSINTIYEEALQDKCRQARKNSEVYSIDEHMRKFYQLTIR